MQCEYKHAYEWLNKSWKGVEIKRILRKEISQTNVHLVNY